MKKIFIALLITFGFLANPTFAAIELDAGTTDSEQKEDIEITNITVLAKEASVPADGESKIGLEIVVDGLDDTLTGEDVKLSIKVKNDNGTIGEITYSDDDDSFNAEYTAGKEEGDVILIVTATDINNEDNTYQTVFSDIKLDKVEVQEEPEATDDLATDLEDNNEDTTDNVTELEDTSTEANITGAELLGANRVKISFDIEVSIPEENPMSAVTIETVEGKKEVKISNIVLGDDNKSVIVSTEDNLGDEAYRVIVNEVLNKSTMKKATLVNSETTVTGTATTVLVILTLLLTLGYFSVRRRK